ncbi:hypothetical protein HAX54_033468, partial [Datura stramonium]|nr:hypothetical protein [Datura stramonium]
RFKQYVLRDSTHGFPENILLEKFYTGLDPLTQSVANNVIGGCFIDKTGNRITTILDKIDRNNHAWHAGDSGVAKGQGLMLKTGEKGRHRNMEAPS